MGKQLTHDEFIAKVKGSTCGSYTFLDKYINVSTRIKTQCNICTYIWSPIANDIMRGHGCPVCAGKAILIGYNDLKTLAPDICEEWNYEKNNGLLPEQFTLKSDKKVWWVCNKYSHEWQARIANRTKGSGCPMCDRMKIGFRTIQRQIKKNGTLESTRPDLLDEWDYDKNNVKSSELTVGSNQRVWWKCKYGHSWSAAVCARSAGSGCPECAIETIVRNNISTRLLKNGSFADNYPEYVKYWDFTLNTKTCYEVTAKSKYIAYWHCPDCGYSWKDRVGSVAKGLGCPNCILHQKYSFIQKITENYIEEKYDYILKHEKNCSLCPRNPKTGYPLLYDNEIIISDDKRLIVEVHGIQHYKINIFVEKSAKSKNISPQEELEYIQWKDNYKKQYALDHGYFYLDLPYWVFSDDTYKVLIDEKIQQILNDKKEKMACKHILNC